MTSFKNIFMIFDIGVFSKICPEIQASLKSDKNNIYFTRRPMFIFDHSLLNSYCNEKFFRQKL